MGGFTKEEIEMRYDAPLNFQCTPDLIFVQLLLSLSGDNVISEYARTPHRG